MSCERSSERILDRLAGELNDRDSLELEQHLSECESCEEEARRLGTFLAGARAARECALDPASEERAVEAIRRNGARGTQGVVQRTARSARPAGGGRRAWILPMRPVPVSVAAAAAVICLAVGFWSGRTSVSRSVPPAAVPSETRRPAAPASRPQGPAAARPRVVPHVPGPLEERPFATAPSDAICLALVSMTDTL